MSSGKTIRPSIEIRDIEQEAEFRAVEGLQKEVWGIGDLDVVPYSNLVAVTKTGGVLAGAFDGPKLVGFVYGFLGFERNTTVIHSHMLAVSRSYRGLGLGYRLKLAQRERALALDINQITWTFDPLQSLNAHLNFQKLGVYSDQYDVDFYGTSASTLHQLGTDRLWLSWQIETERVRQRLEGHDRPTLQGLGDLPRLVFQNVNGTPSRVDLPGVARQRIGIEIPADIDRLQKEDMERALEWRTVTRAAFQEALAAGYRVEEFFGPSEPERVVGSYLLVRRAAEG